MRGKTVIVLLLLWSGLSECHTSISEIGADFFTNKSPFDISAIDTATLKVSTILRDSVNTTGFNPSSSNPSGPNRLLIGFHNDEKLGTLTATGIFRLNAGAPGIPDKKTTEYVGLRLFLKKDGYYFYDASQPQTISVYQLERILNSPTGAYYNTSPYTIDPAKPLGTLTFLPRPDHVTDSLEVTLSDSVGQALFAMAQVGDPRLTDSDQFNRFFKGLAIVPDTTNSGSILGFKAAVEMRVYYYDHALTPVKLRYFAFTVGTYFSKIHANREGTKLSPIKKRSDEVISINSDNESYFQSGTGVAMRIELPYIHLLRNIDPSFFVTRAILEIKPIKSSYAPIPIPYASIPIPSSVIMYYVDQQNNNISTSMYPATLIQDDEYGRNTHYQADVTTFVNAQLTNLVNVHNALLILPSPDQNRSTVNRGYFGDQQNQYEMKLRLFYLTLPNQQN